MSTAAKIPAPYVEHRSPTSKIPKYLHSEESAIMQLLSERFGWRFVDFQKERDRTTWFANMNDLSKGGTVRTVKLVIPLTSVLARRLDESQRAMQRAKQRKKRDSAVRRKNQRSAVPKRRRAS